jgi:DNA-binding Lrp family transcriptional regulator
MRYRKGHVAISEDRDVPVLLHIRNARAITLDQLWELLALEKVEESRRSAQWRISRLEKSGLIERIDAGRFFRQPVFAITTMGMSLLEYRGHTLVSVSSETGHLLHSSQIFHALELVNIRLALAKNGSLRSWKTEIEVASRNLVYSSGAAKDFDALAEIQYDVQLYRIGIEYERTVKAAARYAEIRESLNRDRSADMVLYLASSYDVLHVLAVELRGASKHIGFATSDQFCGDLFNASTLLNTADHNLVPFAEFLTFEPASLR